MSKYTTIADIGNALVGLLKKELVPDTIQNPDVIGLCSPAERGDFLVGIHLYNIQENEDIRVNTMTSRGVDTLQNPSMYVSLQYMITVTSMGDIKFRSSEEHKILGRILQIFHDYPCLDSKTFEPVEVRKPMDISIQIQNLTLEEKMRIYSVPNAEYKLSLFYKISPVEIQSTKTRKVTRVTDMDFRLQEKSKR